MVPFAPLMPLLFHVLSFVCICFSFLSFWSSPLKSPILFHYLEGVPLGVSQFCWPNNYYWREGSWLFPGGDLLKSSSVVMEILGTLRYFFSPSQPHMMWHFQVLVYCLARYLSCVFSSWLLLGRGNAKTKLGSDEGRLCCNAWLLVFLSLTSHVMQRHSTLSQRPDTTICFHLCSHQPESAVC